MRRQLRILTAMVLMFAWVALPSGSEPPATPSDEEGFVARIRGALEAGDRAAISSLSYWEGIDDELKTRQEELWESLFYRPVKHVELRPVPNGYRTEYATGGKIYRTSLPVAGLVRIEFEGPDDAKARRLLPYGNHDGQFYIVRMRAETLEEPVVRDRQLHISVMALSAPALDYRVSCSYEAREGEVRETFEGTRSINKVVWGQKINWCRVENRSKTSWVQLVLKDKDETYYESSRAEPGQTITYP